jgi:hypothetical protein
MAIITTKVHDLTPATDPAKFEVGGFDTATNAPAKILASLFVGPTGPAPNITIQMTAVPYGTAPSVDKSGTDTAPVFNIKFPLAQDGRTPQLRVSGGYLQYRYADTEAWANLVSMSTFKGDTGPAPNMTIVMTPVPYGTAPSVEKSGTATDPVFEIKFPLAQNGKTPMLQVAGGYMQYRYSESESWVNIVEMSILKGEKGDAGADGKTPVFDGSSASVLDPSQPPTVSTKQTGTDKDGNPIYALVLAIPQGQRGIQGAPPILVNGTINTGAPGSDVVFTFTYSGVDAATGSPRYRIDGSIPQGMSGSGNGNVKVDASTLVAGKQYIFVPSGNGSPEGTFREIVIPDTQVQADWGQTDSTAKDFIKGKPILATVATSGAYNDLTGRPNLVPSFVTGNTFTATATGVSQTQQVRSIQNGVGTPVVTQLPVVTENAAGMMPASAFKQIQENSAAIQSIIQGGGKEWPSVATKADLDALGMPSSATQNDVIKVRNDETHDGATTQYVATDTGGGLEWVYNLVVNFDPVGLATTTTPGLKKSSTKKGQIFTEADGTDSLNGYDEIVQDIETLNTELLEKANTSDMEEALAAKQDTLTSANAGDGIEISPGEDGKPVISAAGGGEKSGIIEFSFPRRPNSLVIYEDDYVKVSAVWAPYSATAYIEFLGKTTDNRDFYYSLEDATGGAVVGYLDSVDLSSEYSRQITVSGRTRLYIVLPNGTTIDIWLKDVNASSSYPGILRWTRSN